jgi:hypothetical protein
MTAILIPDDATPAELAEIAAEQRIIREHARMLMGHCGADEWCPYCGHCARRVYALPTNA